MAMAGAMARRLTRGRIPLIPHPPPFEPVGGIVAPVSKLGLMAPWMGLVALASLAALTVALVRRRKP